MFKVVWQGYGDDRETEKDFQDKERAVKFCRELHQKIGRFTKTPGIHDSKDGGQYFRKRSSRPR